MQPAGQDETSGKPWSILRQGHKHTLRNVFGQVRVPNHPQRGGIDEVNVPRTSSANAASDRRSV